jgi:hypothetical protein
MIVAVTVSIGAGPAAVAVLAVFAAVAAPACAVFAAGRRLRGRATTRRSATAGSVSSRTSAAIVRYNATAIAS